MAEPDDELAGTEQPFVVHLIELRDRLIRAMLAVLIVGGVMFVWPGPSRLYDWLASPLIDRVRRVNPVAALAAYGLYAPINEAWLREKGVAHVLGPEGEEELVALCAGKEGSFATRPVGARRSLRSGPACAAPARSMPPASS